MSAQRMGRTALVRPLSYLFTLLYDSEMRFSNKSLASKAARAASAQWSVQGDARCTYANGSWSSVTCILEGFFCSFHSLALFLLDFLMSNGMVELELRPFPQGKEQRC